MVPAASTPEAATQPELERETALTEPMASPPAPPGRDDRRAGFAAVLCLALALLAGGCAELGIGGPDPLDDPTWIRAPQAVATLIPRPVPKPEPPPRRPRLSSPRPSEPPAVPGEGPPAAIELVPEIPALPAPPNLVGADQTAVAELLGLPDTAEEEPPAVRWTYSTPNCSIDIFFFMEVSTRTFRVLSHEVSGYDILDDPDRQCFAELRAQGRRPAS